MNVGLLIIYILFAAVSIIPVIKLEEVRSNKQYRILWYLSIFVFTWTILTGLYLIAIESFVFYYSRLLTYPILFLVSYSIFVTFQVYTNHQTPKYLHYIAVILFLIEVIVSLTNTYHLQFVKMEYSSSLTKDVYSDASRGLFFYVHAIICYIILLFGFARMLIFLKRREKHYRDIFPFPMILISLLLGISLNVIHLFFYHFPIDPTYLFVVLITFILYMIIYKRDFNVNLILSSKKFIFTNMREMYVIVDNKKTIIEYSNNLIERFSFIDFRIGDSVKEFYRKLKPYTIIYHDINEIKDLTYDEKIIYLHINDQEYRIDRFSEYGELILLYDESITVKMMHEIDVIRSHDQMTNLYNRNYFEENHVAFEKQYPELGLIIIDVDGLKLFNDFLGHRQGDELIIKFSKILLKLNDIYSDLIPIRFGGDEFLIIAPKADQKKMEDIMSRIIEGSNDDNPLENVSFSYGYALRKNNEKIHAMIKRADRGLYELKASHKDYKSTLVKALKKASAMMPSDSNDEDR